jgi:uncharacterized protein YbgA (DUF1722 family)
VSGRVVAESTTWILNLYIEPLRNNTNQLYYSKGYRTTEIGGLFCVTGYLKSVFNSTYK